MNQAFDKHYAVMVLSLGKNIFKEFVCDSRKDIGMPSPRIEKGRILVYGYE
jgi:hypothetical protein